MIKDIPSSALVKGAKYVFNPTLLEHVSGEIILAYRAEFRGGKASIWTCTLDKNLDVIPDSNMLIPVPHVDPDVNYKIEDPRLFRHDGRVYLLFHNYNVDAGCTNIGLADINSNGIEWSVSDVKYLNYGVNHNAAIIKAESRMTAQGAVYRIEPQTISEKNWTMFSHDGKLYLNYYPNPHTVALVNLKTGKAYTKYNTGFQYPAWGYGEIRGGTCPVLVNDMYYTFFHSSFKPTLSKIKHYVMGALAFEAKPPFAVKKLTLQPLLRPQVDDPNRPNYSNSVRVIFPNGAIHRNGEWIVSYGHNDYCCKLFTIKHEELLSKMEDVESLDKS